MIMPAAPVASGDQFVLLRGATWGDYQRLLRIRGDRSAPRITYLEGCIEIMSPSRSHESVKSILGSLVETYCMAREIEFQTLGSWTIGDRKVDRGAEPDECYVFGDDPDPKRPELAIEVVWTSGGIDKLDVYRKLGVREVWYWEAGLITPYVLRRGRYVKVARSVALPRIDLALLARFVDRPTTSAAIRAYRAALGRQR